MDGGNRSFEHLIETLKDPNDVWECIITLLSLLDVSKEKEDQIISMNLRKSLAVGVKAKSSSYFKQKAFNVIYEA